MARKKKKSRARSKPPEEQLTIEQLEARAAENLEAGNPRQAVKDARKLCGHDRERYESLLRRAGVALVDSLLLNGKVSQARTVFASLGNLPPTPECDALTVRLARETGDFAAAAEAAARLLTTAASDDGGDSDGDDRSPLLPADVLVLSFAEFPPSQAAAHPVPAAELRQVHRALALICEQSYDEALAAVRGLGRHSPFAHWRLFVKGLAAFYRGEDDKARQAFERLPEMGSWLADAASPFLLLLLPVDDAHCRQLAKDEERLRAACRLAGRSELAEVLPRANYLWMTGRYRDSFRFLRRSRIGFPAETPDVIGSLTRFYYNAAFLLEDEAGERYVDFLFEEAEKSRGKNPTLMLRGIRLVALFSEGFDGEEEAVFSIWQDFLFCYQTSCGRNPRLASLVYAHVGELFARTEEAQTGINPFLLLGLPDPVGEQRYILNPEMAEKCFQSAVKEDEWNRLAWLSLLNLYDQAGWKSKRNRLLDEIVKRFPDDKAVLVRAGAGCCDRGAWDKGRKYYRRALDLDQRDRALQERFILAVTRLALKQAVNGRLKRCFSLLDEVLAIARPEMDHFNLGSSYLLGRWSVFFLLAAENDHAWDCFEQALKQAPNEPKFLYFFWLYALGRGIDPRSLGRLEKSLKKMFRSADIAAALELLEVFEYCLLLVEGRDEDDGFMPLLEKEEKKLRRLLTRVVRRADTDQVVRVAEYAVDDAVTGRGLFRACLRRLRSLDSRSPYYLFYASVAEVAKKKIPYNEDIDSLRHILSLAEETRDQVFIARVKKHLEQMEAVVALVEEIKSHGDGLTDFNHLMDDFVDDHEGESDDWEPDFPPPPGAVQVPPSWLDSHRFGSGRSPDKSDRPNKEVPPPPETPSLLDLLDD